MARKRKTRPTPKVTLPPFTWDTRTKLPDGTEARLARPGIEQAEIETGASQGADGHVVLNRARVWRVKTPATLRILNPALRAAILDYAEAFETVHSSGGTCDPTGGSRDVFPQGPNLRAITAAELLRKMDASLVSGELVVPLKEARRIRRGDGQSHVNLQLLARWVAIEELTRTEILQKAGAATSNPDAHSAFSLAIVEVGERLARCCGYTDSAN